MASIAPTDSKSHRLSQASDLSKLSLAGDRLKRIVPVTLLSVGFVLAAVGLALSTAAQHGLIGHEWTASLYEIAYSTGLFVMFTAVLPSTAKCSVLQIVIILAFLSCVFAIFTSISTAVDVRDPAFDDAAYHEHVAFWIPTCVVFVVILLLLAPTLRWSAKDGTWRMPGAKRSVACGCASVLWQPG